MSKVTASSQSDSRGRYLFQNQTEVRLKSPKQKVSVVIWRLHLCIHSHAVMTCKFANLCVCAVLFVCYITDSANIMWHILMDFCVAGSGWFWLALADSDGCFGWIWLALVRFSCIWLALAGFGWAWLALAGSDWLWLALAAFGLLWQPVAGSGWLCLFLARSGLLCWVQVQNIVFQIGSFSRLQHHILRQIVLFARLVCKLLARL